MEDLVALFGIVFLFGAPVAAWIVSRVLAHQERMEMIRRGYMPPPTAQDAWSMKQAAKYGRYASGPVPPPGVPGMQQYEQGIYAQQQLRKGVTVTLVGFALLIGLSFIDVHTPGPWLLGGLIPMFVGIAQIIIAVMNGARFNFPAQGGPSSGTSFGPASSGSQYGQSAEPPPPPPSGPYAWRPGATPEIEKPVPPPDPR